MQWIIRFINDVLGPVSIVIGVITVFPILWTWWEVTFGRKRQHRRWFTEVQKTAGTRPSILIVDLLEAKNIVASVEHYRQEVEALKSIPGERMFILSRDRRLTPKDMPALSDELRSAAANIIRASTDTLHVFYAGPVVPMALIGAEFANLCRVLLYQHNPTGYDNWGPLRHHPD